MAIITSHHTHKENLVNVEKYRNAGKSSVKCNQSSMYDATIDKCKGYFTEFSIKVFVFFSL